MAYTETTVIVQGRELVVQGEVYMGGLWRAADIFLSALLRGYSDGFTYEELIKLYTYNWCTLLYASIKIYLKSSHGIL